MFSFRLLSPKPPFDKNERRENYYLCDFMRFSLSFVLTAKRGDFAESIVAVDLKVNSFDEEINTIKDYKWFEAAHTLWNHQSI